MRITFIHTAGPDERFASDFSMRPGPVTINAAGERHEGQIVSAERLDAERLKITVEVPDDDQLRGIAGL